VQDSSWLRRLVERTGDPLLAADLPPPGLWPKPPQLEGRAVLAIDCAAGDTGAGTVFDAALLPGGRCALALGEAGVRVLARDGRTLGHIDQPAHRLVISDRRDRAIAIAMRGHVRRLARLDLAARAGAPWCDARIDCVAPDFDGGLWFVGIGDELLAIDPLARELTALWHVRTGDGEIAAIARTPSRCSAVVAHAAASEIWTYELR